MSNKRGTAKGRSTGGGILGDDPFPDVEPGDGPALKSDQLVWRPTLPSTPLKDPFENVFPFNRSAAEQEKYKQLVVETRKRVVRILGLPPNVTDEELNRALAREQRLNEQAGAKVRAGAKRGGRPSGSERAAQLRAEFLRLRPITSRNISDSQLATKIGKEVGLKKCAAIDAIKSIKKVCRKPV